ncbi:MAG: hypothetical protein LBN22_04460 [Clostridiales Family XIII bacterium]|jgi:uncharacterized membrane protein|nr:hypothetical protein [Clostridiales Family XIII bacterium]
MLKKCNANKFNKTVTALLLIVGIASIVLGICLFVSVPESAHGLSSLAGILTGMGAVFTVFGICSLIKHAKLTPEQKRQLAIEANDERNVMVTGKAFVISSITGIALCFIVGVVFFALDNIDIENVVVGYAFIACMFVQTVTFVAAHSYYNRKY